MISCQVETLSGFAGELAALPMAHQEEADLLQARFPRAVKVEPFFALEKTGRLLCVTLREDGRLIGYSGGLVANDPQRMTPTGQAVPIFSEMGVYVVPGKRGHAVSMMRLLIREATERGAKIIYLRGPTDSQAARFFQALGCEPVETTYAKVVGME